MARLAMTGAEIVAFPQPRQGYYNLGLDAPATNRPLPLDPPIPPIISPNFRDPSTHQTHTNS